MTKLFAGRREIPWVSEHLAFVLEKDLDGTVVYE